MTWTLLRVGRTLLYSRSAGVLHRLLLFICPSLRLAVLCSFFCKAVGWCRESIRESYRAMREEFNASSCRMREASVFE